MPRTEQIDQGRVHGHIAHAEKPRGGVVLLPTIFGVDRFAQGRANLLAEAGFTTLIWNPYPGEGAPTEYPVAQAKAGKLSDDMVADMSECATHLIDTLKLPKVAVQGFCLGGRYALLMAAADKRMVGCSAFYPSIREPMKSNERLDALAKAADIACPVQVTWGTADQVIVKPTFLKLREALETRKAATLAEVYPGAVHSFLRGDLQSEPANATATRISWPSAVRFLETCLQTAS
jgi:carboxymethylenebutenolidase